ncbi:gliding motility protein GldL [Formosa sp. Hel1_33_131]|uniref:type IX secretion system motor protein PorL/GldL n=1 Tax=Formosa sp. Hel1_33_131 TaxID=1336794 RepID=UPI00084E0C5C|nr:gliding motility protein GldL [Formosa sp. Hel1_33_131]AOR28683.1 gliding motility protein GldL [Formosa sp. Hel1_33_131]
MAFKINKKVMNMAYGLGAAVVIIGALMKIIHKDLGPLTGSMLLTIGLVTEALIFALSAFDAPDEELDWTKAYPELAGGKAKAKGAKEETPEGVLTKKLDSLLKEAKIDGALVTSLGDSIRNLNSTASGMGGSMGASQKYSEEMAKAAAQMESINSLYKAQLESAGRQADINQESIENATKLKEQMESLASNLSSLNGVYGGMLSAMNKN